MTRRGLRSESQSEKEDQGFPPAQTSPTLSGEESSMEDQPSLKQIMDLLTQLQIQQSQTQLELASMKAALTGSPLREEQPVALQPLVGEEQSAPAETNEDSSPVEEHIPPAGTTETADFNTKPATPAYSHTESANSGRIGPGVSDEGRQTMEEKIRKWVNRISMLNYVDVKDKSAVDLHKRLSKLGDEFIRHTGRLATDDAFTLELMSRDSEKEEIARGFCAVLCLKAETSQILSMKIDTLKGLLSNEFPKTSIEDIVNFVKTLPGDIHFPQDAEELLQTPIIKHLKYSNFETNWRNIKNTSLVNVIISKFGPAVRPQIESELTSVDDSIRLGTLFDVIDNVSVEKDSLVSIFNSMRKQKMLPPSSSGTSNNSERTTSGKTTSGKTNSGKNSGQNNGQNVGGQSSDSSDRQFNCFKCGGDHHSSKCDVTTPTVEQKAAGKAQREAYFKSKRKKGKDTNSTGITQKTT